MVAAAELAAAGESAAKAVRGDRATRTSRGQGLVPTDIDFISYDPTDNSLIVQGTEEAIQELQTRIGLFDNAPRQILIKVEFITTTETVDRSFGTEFLYQRGVVFAGTRPGSFVRSGDPVFLNYASGNVTGRLRASLVEGKGKVVSAPIIRTMNNQPASISAVVSQFIFINQLAGTGNIVINVPTPYELDATTSLSVAPRINDDNTITLYLNPTITAFVGTSTSPDGQEIPNRTQQSLSVVARVRNGETMVLGRPHEQERGQQRQPRPRAERTADHRPVLPHEQPIEGVERAPHLRHPDHRRRGHDRQPRPALNDGTENRGWSGA